MHSTSDIESSHSPVSGISPAPASTAPGPAGTTSAPAGPKSAPGGNKSAPKPISRRLTAAERRAAEIALLSTRQAELKQQSAERRAKRRDAAPPRTPPDTR